MATTNNCDPQSSSDSTCDFIIPLRNVFFLFIPETSQQFGYCLYSLTKNQSTTVVQGTPNKGHEKTATAQPFKEAMETAWRIKCVIKKESRGCESGMLTGLSELSAPKCSSFTTQQWCVNECASITSCDLVSVSVWVHAHVCLFGMFILISCSYSILPVLQV